jgi:hypothetical protein
MKHPIRSVHAVLVDPEVVRRILHEMETILADVNGALAKAQEEREAAHAADEDMDRQEALDKVGWALDEMDIRLMNLGAVLEEARQSVAPDPASAAEADDADE